MSTEIKKIEVTKDNFGDLIIEGMGEAIAHARGKITLKHERLELPKQPPKYSRVKIKKLRENILKVSQPVFALYLGVSADAVKAWEQGNNKPNGAVRRLFQLIETNSQVFLKSITG